MNIISELLAGLLFSMACNLDTILLSMGYAAKGIKLSLTGSLIIAAVTTAITWASLAVGALGSGLLDRGFSDLVGGLILAGIGVWLLLDFLGKGSEEDAPKKPGVWAWVTLAMALAANNAGIGVAAGVSGLSPTLCAACNFAVTLLFLPLGRVLGSSVAGKLLGKYALPLSGVLLIILGVWEAFF